MSDFLKAKLFLKQELRCLFFLLKCLNFNNIIKTVKNKENYDLMIFSTK